MIWRNILIFLSGAIFYDGVNHLILAFEQSPYSVHGVFIGLGGNWLVAIFDIVFAGILIWVYYSKSRKNVPKT